MVAQLCEYTKNQWITHLSGWIVWYVSFITIKLLFVLKQFPGKDAFVITIGH